jgi:hypothetical protein
MPDMEMRGFIGSNRGDKLGLLDLDVVLLVVVVWRGGG